MSVPSAEIRKRVAELVEGLEQEVENAPVLTAAELTQWARKLGQMPPAKMMDESLDFIYAFAKSMKVGAVELSDVM